MKKLLSLLSVLTISGSVVPTTIAASPYEKEEQKDNKLSLFLENNNNFSWLDTISAFWEIGIKKTEEIKDYLVKNFENIKNGLENLTITDLFNFFEKKIYNITLQPNLNRIEINLNVPPIS